MLVSRPSEALYSLFLYISVYVYLHVCGYVCMCACVCVYIIRQIFTSLPPSGESCHIAGMLPPSFISFLPSFHPPILPSILPSFPRAYLDIIPVALPSRLVTDRLTGPRTCQACGAISSLKASITIGPEPRRSIDGFRIDHSTIGI